MSQENNIKTNKVYMSTIKRFIVPGVCYIMISDDLLDSGKFMTTGVEFMTRLEYSPDFESGAYFWFD